MSTENPTPSDSPQREVQSVAPQGPARVSPAPDATEHRERAAHAHEPSASTNTESTSSDKLTALPGISSSPGSRIHVQQQRASIPVSSSDPSIHGAIVPHVYPPIPSRAMPAGSSSESSAGQHVGGTTPPQRFSLEGARNYATVNYTPRSQPVHISRETGPAPRSAESAPSRLDRPSEPPKPPSVIRVHNFNTPATRRQSIDSPGSRAASPMRLFQWGFHRRDQHDREEPFVPVNPYQFKPRRYHFSLINSPDLENAPAFDSSCEESLLWCFPAVSCNPKDRFQTFLGNVRYFMTYTLPRQVYLHLLLRLPSLYFSRIAQLFEDAHISQHDVARMIAAYPPPRRRNYKPNTSPIPLARSLPAFPAPDEWTPANASPALVRFKKSWEEFINSLLREWKTLNLVSALLLSAILSMFQNQEMAYDPIVRTTALLSLTCAIMSLSSMIFFITSILIFVWRSGSTSDPSVPDALSPSAATAPRVLISALILLGLLYFGAIVKTLHGYGLDKESTDTRTPQDRVRAPDAEHAGGREEEQQRGRTQAHELDDRPVVEHKRGGGGDRDDPDQERKRDEEQGRDQGDGGLPAMTGLGLIGLDAVADRGTSSQQEQREGSENHRVMASF
ncbi:hypothetical protein ID866_3018 [Astraeus odoratus]|nr:hypothetical protein ID866_3018 [Astraeus odoratus]